MKEREAFEVFPRSQPHGVKIYFATNSGKISKRRIGDLGHTPSCQERPGWVASHQARAPARQGTPPRQRTS